MIRLRDVAYRYPFHAEPAVARLNLEVRPGEVLACTGSSGSGKSTLVRLATGLIPHYFKGHFEGQAVLAGRDSREHGIGDISQDVGTLFQDPEQQFFALCVEDELAFALEWRGLPPAEIRRRIDAAAGEFGLAPIMSSPVLELSEGQKQKVALAAVCALRPRVLVLDEPTANLDPESTLELAGMLARLKDKGLAVIVVDHRLYWLDGLADAALIMERGRVAQSGSFAMLHDPALRQRYGLRAVHVADPREALPAPGVNGHSAIATRELSFSFRRDAAPVFDKLTFSLPKGKVTALLGPNGAGKTTLARILAGLLRARSGEILMDGGPTGPRQLLHRSSIVLQNTDHQLHMRTVREELETTLRLAADATGAKDPAHAANRLMHVFGIMDLAGRHPQSLSGGEKQRLVIACGLARHPDVLILDEPTSGLDGRNMAVIAENLNRFAEAGGTALVISHDLELLQRTCSCALRLTATIDT